MNLHKYRRIMALAIGTGACISGASGQPLAETTIRIDLDAPEDVGQNLGTFFEITDEAGRPVAGAGVVSVSNTHVRGDRCQLCVYVRPPDKEPSVELQRLPRPSADSGVNLFTWRKRIYAFSHQYRNSDSSFRYWDQDRGIWVVDDTMTSARDTLGEGWIQATIGGVLHNGVTIGYSATDDPASYLYEYYAAGHLFIRQYDANSTEPGTLHAIPWTSGQSTPVNPRQGATLVFAVTGEFPYCYGQYGNDVLVGTSRGALHAFDGTAWRTIVQPSLDVSSQFYSILNYENVALIGHYPSGFLWAFDGEHVRQMRDWPPVPSGASPQAREAQTMFIHAGELYVGVWPWGELWRMDRDDHSWHLVQRVFTHPAVEPELEAPYAHESEAAGDAYNRWGQRIMGMASLGDSLYIATSAKSPEPYNPQTHQFLSDGRWEEYGAVLRVRCGHNLAVPLKWKNEPTRVEVQFRSDHVRVVQDGIALGELRVDPAIMSELRIKDVAWGAGVYGRCAFPISGTVTRDGEARE